MTQTTSSTRWPLLAAGIVALLLIGGAGGWLWQSHRLAADPAGGLAAGDRAAIEKVVHDYVLDHPEILPQAMENLRKNEDSKLLAGLRSDVETPFPGAMLGNPDGKIVVVEFADYACGYCKQTVANLNALIAENPQIKVVMRELPILSPQSADAAKMALAAGEQGKYPAFHNAMYEIGKPNAQTIEAAAKVAGVDLERARRFIADPRLEAEIDRNMNFARQLNFTGTPSWVVGDRLLVGAQTKEELAKAVAEIKG